MRRYMLVLLPLAALISCGTTNTPERVSSPGTQTVDSDAPTTKATESFKVGDEVKLGDWGLIVHGADDPYEPTGTYAMKPDPGTRYVRVDATVKNLGKKPATVSTMMCFEIQDPEGRTYSEAMPPDMNAKGPDGEIEPGGVRRGYIFYKVPTTATSLKMRFKCDLNAGTAIVNL